MPVNATESSSPPASEASPGRQTVVLVDDHISIRQMLAFIIPREGPYDIVAQVSSATDAVEKCIELKPRLVILDLLLPGVNGAELVRRLRSEARETRVLVYSGTRSERLVADTLRAQPHGFVHKEDTLQAFREALRAVMAGGNFVTPLAVELSEKSEVDPKLQGLTERERLVLKLLARGMSNKQIADETGIAVKTVEYHRSNLVQKLGIHDVASLTRFAISHGLVSLE